MDPPSKRRRLAHASRHQHLHHHPNGRWDLGPEASAISQYAATFRTVPQDVEEIHHRIQTQAAAESRAGVHRRQESGSGLLAISAGVELSPAVSVGIEIGTGSATQTQTGPLTTATASTTQPPSGSLNSTTSLGNSSTTHNFRVTQNSSVRSSNGTVSAANAIQTIFPSLGSLRGSSTSGAEPITEMANSTFTEVRTQTTMSTVGPTTGVGSGTSGIASNGTSDNADASPNGATNSGVSRPGAIAGGVVGGAAGLALLVLMAAFIIRWSRRKAKFGHHALQSAPPGGMNMQEDSPSHDPGMAERAGLAPFVAALPGFFRHQTHANEAVPSSERGFTRVSGRKLPSQFSAGISSGSAPESHVAGPERSNSDSSWLRDPFGSDGGSPPEEMILSPGPQRVAAVHVGGPYNALDRSSTPGYPYGGRRSAQSTHDRSTAAFTSDNRASRFTEEV